MDSFEKILTALDHISFKFEQQVSNKVFYKKIRVHQAYNWMSIDSFKKILMTLPDINRTITKEIIMEIKDKAVKWIFRPN